MEVWVSSFEGRGVHFFSTGTESYVIFIWRFNNAENSSMEGEELEKEPVAFLLDWCSVCTRAFFCELS